MSKNKKKKNRENKNDFQPSAWSRWLPIFVFIVVGILVFYPPYFRGLFFAREMFITHIFTGLVFVLVWIDKLRRRDYSFLRTPLDWAVLAYAGAYLLSLIGAVHIGEAFYGFLKALNYFMVYWMVSQVVKDYQNYENILKILLASALGVAAIGILAATGYSHYPSAFTNENGALPRILSTLQYPNTTAAYLAVVSLIGVTLWIRERMQIMRLVYGVSIYLMMLVVLAAFSKGAWVILILGALLLLLGMPGIYRLKSIYIMCVTTIAALITYSKFIPAVLLANGQESASALILLLIGFFIVLVGQVLWEFGIFLYQKKGSKLLIAYVVSVILITLVGLSYLPGKSSLVNQLIPEKLMSRATAIQDTGTTSYIARLDFARWGISIVKEHPVVGTGAGGWNALYHGYQDYLEWTTETHNHFVQVGVEAGALGFLAFISMWVMLMLSVFKLYRAKPRTDQWVLTWGTTTAALTFGVHAAMDFDLSLAAMCILLWTLFALVDAGYGIEILRTSKVRNSAAVASIIVSSFMVLVILISGNSYANAQSYAAQGGVALQQTGTASDQAQQSESLHKAIDLYTRACQADSWNAGYQVDLARCYAIAYKQSSTPNQQLAFQAKEYYEKAREAVARAEKLSPNDIKVRKALLETCSLMGDNAGVTRQGEAAVIINPNDIYAYENLFNIYISTANDYLKINDIKNSREILSKITSLKEQFDAQKQRINSQRPWNGAPLELSKNIQLAIVKSSELLGDKEGDR